MWLINGLFCKVLNLVPRHQLIVARILGHEYSWIATKTIGILEILMAIWIVSKINSGLCTLTQIVIIATMNTIEFILAPDLLLFGHINALVATCFILNQLF
ncbi:DoxX-like family protein [Ginsengibacter hankyongi]|uniref:DoxX-like family protein n=1 Tax=Ginsengibacter hankyongi TaxID=2607284 RepID=UPI001F2EFDCF|nr:DoxX-like family protein [Ginsengibacter hankyongi]